MTDHPLPEDDAIAAAHPLRTGRHGLYAEAERLVHAKNSKAALVDLVNWLLVERAVALANIEAWREEAETETETETETEPVEYTNTDSGTLDLFEQPACQRADCAIRSPHEHSADAPPLAPVEFTEAK